MSCRFPPPEDEYPIICREDTDAALPTNASPENDTRYGEFTPIATGGTCVIESCKDFRLGRVVCRKSLRPEYENDRYEQIRFLREARVTAMLQHPNTLPIYDVSRDESGKYYFTMKLVRGATLREVIDRLRLGETQDSEDWPLRRLINVAVQAGLALEFAHAHGVVHRDIKPGNIIAGPFGEVLLLDWGLAKVWDRDETDIPPEDFKPFRTPGPGKTADRKLTFHGNLRATPLYMSPEQIQNPANVDHRTDIYSFGALLYELLTLEDMAWGDTMRELIDHIEHDLPMPPSQKSTGREIPKTLESVCMQCIQKSPDDRIQTIGEVVRKLQGWM